MKKANGITPAMPSDAGSPLPSISMPTTLTKKNVISKPKANVEPMQKTKRYRAPNATETINTTRARI